MNNTQINDILTAAEEKMLAVRGGRHDHLAAVAIIDRQTPLPQALFLDTNISAGAVRAFGALAFYFPTPFPGMRTLALYLGGADGAVRTTDELFLAGWVIKKIIKNEKNKQAVGTAYVLFPSRKMPSEMAALGVGWIDFVLRLAAPAGSKTDKKAALRRKAREVIKRNPKLFQGVLPISESVNTESEKVNESFLKERSLIEEETTTGCCVSAKSPENQNQKQNSKTPPKTKPKGKTKNQPIDWPSIIPSADRAEIGRQLARLDPAQQKDVIAMLADKRERETVDNVVGYAVFLSRLAAEGKLVVPLRILDRRKADGRAAQKAEIKAKKTEIAARKKAIFAAVADGLGVLLDGEPVETAESGKYIILPNGDYLPISRAILEKRIEVLG